MLEEGDMTAYGPCRPKGGAFMASACACSPTGAM